MRHCCKRRKIAVSIPDCVLGLFFFYIILGSDEPAIKMSSRNVFWRLKAASIYVWQHYYIHVPTVLKSCSLNLLETARPVYACTGIDLPSDYNQRDGLNLRITYCPLFARYRNIQRPTSHPQLRLCLQNNGT